MGTDLSELEARLCNVLDVASVVTRTQMGAMPPAGRDINAGTPPFEKLVSETALLLMAASKAATGRPSVASRIARLACDLEAHARGNRMVAGVRLRPAHLFEYATAHVCLDGVGQVCPTFHAELIAARGATASGMRERLPYQFLALAWIHGRLGWSAPDVDLTLMAAATTLGTGIDHLAGSRSDLYGFTHALMYSTDFGARHGELPRPAGDLVADAAVGVARCLDDDDFDLCAEVLLTWPYLAEPWPDDARFGLRVLCAVEDDAGFLPGLGIDVDEIQRLPDEDRLVAIINATYHTIYVMGILCASIIALGGVVAEGNGTSPRRGLGAELYGTLPECAVRRRWMWEFEGLPPADQDGLANFLVAVAVRRAARVGDLRALRRVLAIVLDHGLSVSPAVVQAADLLTRWSNVERHRGDRHVGADVAGPVAI